MFNFSPSTLLFPDQFNIWNFAHLNFKRIKHTTSWQILANYYTFIYDINKINDFSQEELHGLYTYTFCQIDL